MREGDYVYLLAPPEKAQALDRFFVDMPPPAGPTRGCSAISSSPAIITLGELAEIYGLSIAPEDAGDDACRIHRRRSNVRTPKQGDIVPLGAIALVAQRVTDGRVARSACGWPKS